MKLKIPYRYSIGGQVMEIVNTESLEGKLGVCCLGSGIIKIADTFNGEKQSESSKLNTFYHELVHTVLDTMGRDDLSKDETFVCSFSSFLLDALSNCEYTNEV